MKLKGLKSEDWVIKGIHPINTSNIIVGPLSLPSYWFWSLNFEIRGFGPPSSKMVQVFINIQGTMFYENEK